MGAQKSPDQDAMFFVNKDQNNFFETVYSRRAPRRGCLLRGVHGIGLGNLK